MTHAMKMVVVMTDAFALLDYTIFPLREEAIPPRNGILMVWLFPRAALIFIFVQDCVNASHRSRQLPLEGAVDIIDEHHHGFGIPKPMLWLFILTHFMLALSNAAWRGRGNG